MDGESGAAARAVAGDGDVAAELADRVGAVMQAEAMAFGLGGKSKGEKFLAVGGRHALAVVGDAEVYAVVALAAESDGDDAAIFRRFVHRFERVGDQIAE